MIPNTPIVFFGSSTLVLPVIASLQKNYDLKLIITTEQKETDAVPAFCLQQNIPYLSVTSLSNETIRYNLKAINAPVAVLADFGLIIPQEILSVFPKGIINIHPSLLPKYRGPTPVQSAMLAGEKETGVSIIRLDDQLDHGPLLIQEKELISETDTAETLHERLFQKGAEMLIKTLPDYLTDAFVPTPQDDTKASFTSRLTRQSGYFDSETPPTNLSFMIRAFYPWPGAWTKVVLRSPLNTTLQREVRIKFLPGDRLQVEGKKPMIYKDFLNGYPEKRDWLKNLGGI